MRFGRARMRARRPWSPRRCRRGHSRAGSAATASGWRPRARRRRPADRAASARGRRRPSRSERRRPPRDRRAAVLPAAQRAGDQPAKPSAPDQVADVVADDRCPGGGRDDEWEREPALRGERGGDEVESGAGREDVSGPKRDRGWRAVRLFVDAVLAFSDDPGPDNLERYLAASRALESRHSRQTPPQARPRTKGSSAVVRRSAPV
jgi:hypothetical protein